MMYEPTNADILKWGTCITQYSVNINPMTGKEQQNGAKAHLVLFEDNFYEIITSHDDKIIFEMLEPAHVVQHIDEITSPEKRKYYNVEDDY